MIIISQETWDRMLGIFNESTREEERVAYLDGVIHGSNGVVTTLTIPDAVLASLWFTVSASAMSQAGKHLRANGLVRLAQVHTHPTDWTDHSPHDDAKAYSQMPGSVSIVLPYHGRNRTSIRDAGVHLRMATSWQRLPPHEVGQHITVVPGFLDFRMVAS